MKQSEPISHKNPQFKENCLFDDACFIFDYYGRNKWFLYGPDDLNI